MEAITDRLYLSALLEKVDLEQRLEKNLNDVSSFNNHTNNIKKMITSFKEKSIQSEKKYWKYKSLTTILESFDTIVIIATTSSLLQNLLQEPD